VIRLAFFFESSWPLSRSGDALSAVKPDAEVLMTRTPV
jgi:hypothetical protein